MMVSAAFAILAIGVLVYFLHHIPASIRINTVLGGIGRKLIHDLERRFPIEEGSRQPERRISGTPVTARRIGYVQIIHFAELDDIATEEELPISLRNRTGDLVNPHLPADSNRAVPGQMCSDLVPTSGARPMT